MWCSAANASNETTRPSKYLQRYLRPHLRMLENPGNPQRTGLAHYENNRTPTHTCPCYRTKPRRIGAHIDEIKEATGSCDYVSQIPRVYEIEYLYPRPNNSLLQVTGNAGNARPVF